MKSIFFLFIAMLMAMGSFAQLASSSNLNFHAGGPNASEGQWVPVDEMILGGAGNAPLKISLDQVRNGTGSAPLATGAWVNGNLNGSQAHFAEKWSIPYRLTFTGLPTGTHTVVIEWDTRANGKNALDYITQYELLDNAPGSHLNTFGHAPEPIDPTVGFPSFTKTDGNPIQITAPSSVGSPKTGMPTNSFTALPLEKQKMTIFGGTISGMDYFQQGSLTAAASTSSMTITFNNITSSTVILAWGGHIASEEDWGKGNSASSISGSPYHMRLLSVDGSGGNQDRSLSADAVLDPPPCSLTGPTVAVQCNSNNIYTNTVTDLTGYTFVWSLINSTGGNATFSGPTNNPASVSVNSGTGPCTRSYTVRFTVFKNGVEVSHCDITTPVVDNQAPILNGTLPIGATNQNLCYGDIPLGPSEAAIAALYTDNCGAVHVTKTGTPTGTSCDWTVTYHYVITDDCNNAATPVDITYSGGDKSAPTLKVAGSVPTGSTSQNLCFNAIPAGPSEADIAALYNDNCGAVHVTKTGAPTGSSCSWSVTYHYVITDDCNNAATPVDITYSGGDKSAPTLKVAGSVPTGTTSQNLCFNAIPTGPTEDQIKDLYSDNCGTVHVTKTGTPTGSNCSWTVTYHYVITDDCNNAATPVDITYSGGDKSAPALTGTIPSGAINQNLCFNAIPSGPSEAAIAGLYTDNCGTVHVTKTGTPTGTNCSWTVTYHYVITDDCNNAATPVDITYSGGDKSAPALTGTIPSGAINQNLCFNAISSGPSEAAIAGLYTDNCGTVHVTKTGTPTGTNCSWTVTYHYVITDDCNNAATPVDITYSGGDKSAPALTGTIPSGAINQNLCFNAIPSGPSEAAIAGLYTDNCGTVHVTKTGTPTGTNCSWTVTYHYVITDDCNNAATPVDITYSGGDKTAPTRTGTLPTGATNQNLCFSAIPTGPTEATIAALYTDNCGGTVHVVKTGTPTGTSCSWTVTYHYVITDDCNNAATPVDITYSGGDTESPIITSCPGDQVIECSVNKDDITKTGGGITATDNCGTPSTSYQDVVTNVGCSKVITRTWTATDACAHTATCVQKLIVRDRTLPVFNCVTTGTPTVTDNCTSQANLIVYFKDNGNVRTWTAIDESGNIGTCQQTLPNTLRISGSTNTQVVNTTLVDPKDKKSLSKAQAANASQVQVQAYPNPFKDQIQFVVTSPVSGKGSLDVYNALGQKIRTVYQGNINKGTQNFELHLSQRQVSNLVYVLRVGGQQVSGKILQINQ